MHPAADAQDLHDAAESGLHDAAECSNVFHDATECSNVPHDAVFYIFICCTYLSVPSGDPRRSKLPSGPGILYPVPDVRSVGDEQEQEQDLYLRYNRGILHFAATSQLSASDRASHTLYRSGSRNIQYPKYCSTTWCWFPLQIPRCPMWTRSVMGSLQDDRLVLDLSESPITYRSSRWCGWPMVLIMEGTEGNGGKIQANYDGKRRHHDLTWNLPIDLHRALTAKLLHEIGSNLHVFSSSSWTMWWSVSQHRARSRFRATCP